MDEALFCILISILGVLQAYKACVRKVQLYGPTNFAPVINHVARFAEVYQDGSNYFILLIMTDGVISDMPHTKEVGEIGSCHKRQKPQAPKTTSANAASANP